MGRINMRTRVLLALLLAVALLAFYHVVDASALKREVQAIEQAKAADVLGDQPQKGANTTSTQSVVWRVIPLVGQASAKITVNLHHRTISGSEFDQAFDYFYRRERLGWVEMEHQHEPNSTQHSEHAHGH